MPASVPGRATAPMRCTGATTLGSPAPAPVLVKDMLTEFGRTETAA